jgi:predicted transcriptional regulator
MSFLKRERYMVIIMADLSASKADPNTSKADASKADASKADASVCKADPTTNKADADHEKHKPTASNSLIAIANMIS